jgi:tRNA/tmRNA/rRNA uracil-C5-methylase (TrmA/RlmC/RlmD family)
MDGQNRNSTNSDSSASSVCYLPGYAVQLNESGVMHSVRKLTKVKSRLDLDNSVSIPCTLKSCLSENETVNYRSRCSFQMVLSDDNTFDYAMRSRGTVKKLNCSYFPIACRRIQATMTTLLEALNSKLYTHEKTASEHECLSEGSNRNSDDIYCYWILRKNLSSVSFNASWDEKQCLLTLHYSPPGLISCTNGIQLKQWLAQAEDMRLKCHATNLSGRSRHIHLSVPYTEVTDPIYYIQDEITLDLSEHQSTAKLELPLQITVCYLKPETAFQHPNPQVMHQALKWICLQIFQIRQYKQGSPISLLELYCGYGAHTVPLCKSKLCDKIVAVEIDDRLAQACQANCMANQCDDIVTVVRADAAAVVSRRSTKGRNNALRRKPTTISQKETSIRFEDTQEAALELFEDGVFDVVLVDPPRQGLSVEVCDFLKANESFHHVLYISCGQEALIRDLKLLKDSFDLKEIEILDLFPRTDAVETLVHLQRQQS